MMVLDLLAFFETAEPLRGQTFRHGTRNVLLAPLVTEYGSELLQLLGPGQ